MKQYKPKSHRIRSFRISDKEYQRLRIWRKDFKSWDLFFKHLNKTNKQ